MAIIMSTANAADANNAVRKKKFNSGGLIAFLLVLLAILLLAAAIAAPAIWLHRNYDERLFRMNKEIASFDRANAQRASLLEKREELRAQDSGKYYLKAATPALASAELQDAVKTIVEATVGQGSLQTQPALPKDDGLVRNVSAIFNLQASMPNIRKIFYAIETAQPYLLIENLSMRATVGSNHKSNPGQEPMVMVQFDVTGVALVNAPRAVAATPVTTGAGPSNAASSANSGNVAAGNITKPSAAVAASNSATPSAPPNGKSAAPPPAPTPAPPVKPIAGAKL